MKIRFRYAAWMIAFAAVILCAVAALRLFRPPPDGPTLVNQTREKLRDEGFKTDLSDFNFSTSSDMRVREALITAAMPDRRSGYLQYPDLMECRNDSAFVVWKMDTLKMPGGVDASWDDVRDSLDSNKDNMDAASDAILAGPIAFNLNAAAGDRMFLMHLGTLNNLTGAFGWRTMIALREGDKNSAWTNLLSATRLVTAWQTEPTLPSYSVRIYDERLAFDTTWELLQAHGWPDNQLKQLQNEWQSMNLLTNLSEIAAFRRVSDLAAFQQGQEMMLSRGPGLGVPASELAREALHDRSSLWTLLHWRWHQNEYLHGRIYEDEANMLNYYRDREVGLREAAKASSWVQICAVPGITNELLYRPTGSAVLPGMWNRRTLPVSRPGREASFIGRTAEAETQRRILITAIALERYYTRHGSYPETLANLEPEFLSSVPADFMDGRPLRYRRTDDGHFRLYSVGLDVTDDGGRMSFRELYVGLDSGYCGVDPDGNIVWPPPASDASAQAAETAELNARIQKEDGDEEGKAANQWNHTAQHQLDAEMLLTAPPRKVPEVDLDGTPLSTLLCNTEAARTNRLTLKEMLTLRQIITGQEPEIVTFKVPIRYDALVKLGALALLVDTNNDDSNEGCVVRRTARSYPNTSRTKSKPGRQPT